MSDTASQSPERRWTIGDYTFAQYTTGPQAGKWEASARGRGVGGHRTPLGALLSLRRWMREPAKPWPVDE